MSTTSNVSKILILAILVAVAAVLAQVSGLLQLWQGGSTVSVQATVIDLGRRVLGDKISIKDQIRIKQSGKLAVDGKYLSLGNERKTVDIYYLAEIGYRMADIRSSESVDSLRGKEIISRTLTVELPLPDTLSFVEMRQEEQSQEWFWEGWYRDEVNEEAREQFVTQMEEQAYGAFVLQHIDPSTTTSLMDASKTVLTYVNNAYAIAQERGFDRIVVTFVDESDYHRSVWQVVCDTAGTCTQQEVERRTLEG